MDIIDFVMQEGLIMVPALYILGEIIKATGAIKDKWIPITLLALSLVITPLILGGSYNATNLIQAILVAGVTVFSNQLLVQARKDE